MYVQLTRNANTVDENGVIAINGVNGDRA